MSVTIKVEGLRELDQALSKLKLSTQRAVLRRIARKALQPVLDDAKRLAPVDDGALRDSIQIASTGLSRGAKAQERGTKGSGVRVYVGTANRNAVPNEWGTVRSAGTPFMRPAWDANNRRVLETVKRDLGAEIEATAARAAKRSKR